MTLASEHDVMKNPMKEIVNMLKMDKFHFVVPCAVYKDFKRQRLVRVTENKKKNEESIINQMSKIGISKEIDDVDKENEVQLMNVEKFK